MIKRCPTCEQALPIVAFSIERRRADGRTWQCKACKSAAYKLAPKNAERARTRERSWRRTFNGYLNTTYKSMRSRTQGNPAKSAKWYMGLALCTKVDFLLWAKASSQFSSLFSAWTANGYNKATSPSIDRIDSSKGYEVTNLQWLTHSENARKARRGAHD